MNYLIRVGLLLLASSTAWAANSTALAATFGQKEVKQSNFVVVAVPRQDDYYSLLLIEQLSSNKDCWKESGSSPTQIEPLLLNFDFSGICGRSTDSNGYSIRQAGQDMALQYRLSVQKRQDDVVLLGMPSGGQQGGSVEIGRTRGFESGFLKIKLNPGWRLTKRTYQGKTLGHIYLTTDQPLNSQSIAKAKPTSTFKSSIRSQRSTSPVRISAPSPRLRPVAASSNRSDTVYRVIVKTRTSQEQDEVRRLVPDAFRSSFQGRTVMQVGLFNEKKTAKQIRRKLQRKGLDALYIPENRVVIRPRSIPQTAVSSAGLLPVPSRSAPLGNAQGNRRVARALPPPPPAPSSLVGPRYRVVVKPRSSKYRRKVFKLVPDAFRTSYRGQSMLQVGSFKSRGEAEDRIRLLERKGFDPIMEKTQ